MLDSIKNYPWIWALTVILLVAAILLWRAAMKKRKKKLACQGPEQLLTYKDLEKLKTSFQGLSKEKLMELKGDESLLFAVITNIEYHLDQGEEENAFLRLTPQQQNVYTLWYFVQGIGGRKMCDFFHEFGEPLTTLLVPALKEVHEDELAKIAKAGCEAYDEDNEEASADTKTVEALNTAFCEEYDKIRYYHSVAEYVRRNVDKFIG